MRSGRRRSLGWWALTGYGVLFMIFLYAPLALIFAYSFNANAINMAVWSGFTTDWYVTLFGMRPAGAAFDAAFTENPERILQVVRNSLVVALSRQRHLDRDRHGRRACDRRGTTSSASASTRRSWCCR